MLPFARGEVTVTALLKNGLILAASVALAISSNASALAGACAHLPAPTSDPRFAAVTALQIELCHSRVDGAKVPEAKIVHVARGNAFDVEFGVWTFDLARVRLEIIAAASPGGETAPSFKLRSGALFAINGGYFDFGPKHELRPVGLFLDNGRIKNPLGHALSGTFLIAGRRVELKATSAVGKLAGYTFGLQSKPLLVDPGNKLGMRSDDGLPLPRSAVCMPDAKHVSFFYAGKGGLSLFELATLLQAPIDAGGFACDIALNLDGGPSTQVAAAVDGAPFERLGQNVANAIVVLPLR